MIYGLFAIAFMLWLDENPAETRRAIEKQNVILERIATALERIAPRRDQK